MPVTATPARRCERGPRGDEMRKPVEEDRPHARREQREHERRERPDAEPDREIGTAAKTQHDETDDGEHEPDSRRTGDVEHRVRDDGRRRRGKPVDPDTRTRRSHRDRRRPGNCNGDEDDRCQRAVGQELLSSLRDEDEVRRYEEQTRDGVPDDGGAHRESVQGHERRVPRSSARRSASVATRLTARRSV